MTSFLFNARAQLKSYSSECKSSLNCNFKDVFFVMFRSFKAWESFNSSTVVIRNCNQSVVTNVRVLSDYCTAFLLVSIGRWGSRYPILFFLFTNPYMHLLRERFQLITTIFSPPSPPLPSSPLPSPPLLLTLVSIYQINLTSFLSDSFLASEIWSVPDVYAFSFRLSIHRH